MLELRQNGPSPIVFSYLVRAKNLSEQSLQLLAPDAAADLGVIHNQLGTIYRLLQRAPSATLELRELYKNKMQEHYLQAINCMDCLGDPAYAAGTRLNFAKGLKQIGLRDQSKEMARVALATMEGRSSKHIETLRNEIQNFLLEL